MKQVHRIKNLHLKFNNEITDKVHQKSSVGNTSFYQRLHYLVFINLEMQVIYSNLSRKKLAKRIAVVRVTTRITVQRD